MAYTVFDQTQQRTNLLNLFNDDESCDVTFIVGKDRKEIKVHRVLLASVSPVFKAMLFGNMKESEPGAEVEIVDIDASAFESVIKYAYCNDPVLTADNFMPILYICDKYQISSMKRMCDRHFDELLTSQNICTLLDQLISFNLSSWIKKIETLLSKKRRNLKASEILESSGFRSMSAKAMVIFLQSDGLNIKEEDLWEAVVKWAEHKAFDGGQPLAKKRKLNNGQPINAASQLSEDDMKLSLLKTVCPFIRFGFMMVSIGNKLQQFS